MTFLATGNAMEALLDAVIPVLRADASVSSLVTGVFPKLSQTQRTAHPYIRVSDPVMDDDFGGMGIGGGRVQFALDVWHRTPHNVYQVLAAAAKALERTDLTVVGHKVAGGSLHCTETRVFDEPDPDKPEATLYHGHQAWEALVEEA